MTEGKKIKVSLILNDKTQNWLVDQLRERGVTVDKTALSMYLNGRREGPQAETVIALAKEILDEYESAV